MIPLNGGLSLALSSGREGRKDENKALASVRKAGLGPDYSPLLAPVFKLDLALSVQPVVYPPRLQVYDTHPPP